jgi:cytochrome c oxidase subunit 2
LFSVPWSRVWRCVLYGRSGAFAAEPLPWQMGLQPPAGTIAEMADDLHNLLLVVITLISLFVLGLLVYVGVRFRASANPVRQRRHIIR